jgi:hypothetical protein
LNELGLFNAGVSSAVSLAGASFCRRITEEETSLITAAEGEVNNGDGTRRRRVEKKREYITVVGIISSRIICSTAAGEELL